MNNYLYEILTLNTVMDVPGTISRLLVRSYTSPILKLMNTLDGYFTCTNGNFLQEHGSDIAVLYAPVSKKMPQPHFIGLPHF